ncbi:MAG: MFS transporter [Ktedonobacteraceae bacterium]
MSTETPVVTTTDNRPEPLREKGWLINRNFTLLSVGQGISNMGDFVYSTTLLIWVFTLGGSAAAVSGVLVAQALPMFVLGPIAGVFVDRWHRLRTMLTSDLARAVIALLPLLAPEPLRLPAIYTSVLLISAISCFFNPARSAVIQVIVSEQDQPQAASLGQVTFALSFIIGPVLASSLYFLVGPVIAISINAASYAVSALCLWHMRVPMADLLPSAFKGKTGSLEHEEELSGIAAILHELQAGFGFVWKTRVLLVITILVLIGMLGAGAINALDIIFVTQRLHASANLYGYLSAAGGLGMLAGAVLAGLLAKRIQARRMLAGSLILLGLGLSIYALQTWFVIALVFNALLCMTQGGLEVAFGPLLMSVTPRRLMGRVQSVINTAMFGASLFSSVLAGFLGGLFPVYMILFGGGLLIALAGLFGWLALPAPVSAPMLQEKAELVDEVEKVPVVVNV